MPLKRVILIMEYLPEGVIIQSIPTKETIKFLKETENIEIKTEYVDDNCDDRDYTNDYCTVSFRIIES